MDYISEMNNLVANLNVKGTQEFMGKEIPVVEGGFGDGQRCLTDKTIAEIHGMRNSDIRRRIDDNIKRFKEKIDYIDLRQRVHDTHTLINLGYAKQSITQAEHIYLLSERGYAKLVKIMDTDLAWEIHDKLIDEYFTMRKVINSSEQLKANLLLEIYNGGEGGVIASKKLAEMEVDEAKKPLIEEINEKDTIINTAINDDALFDVGMVGKLLKPHSSFMGDKKIFNFLRDKKIFIDKPNTQKHNSPYDKYNKYFEMRAVPIYKCGYVSSYIKPYFNGRGLKWFLKRLANEGYISHSEIEEIKYKCVMEG